MLAECARMLWRRRLWCAVALLLAVVAGVGSYVAIAPGQESKAQVLFLGSVKQPGVVGPTNPYLNFGGSLAITASAVQQGVTSDQAAQALYDAGNRATYTVEPNLNENAGPVLLITVDDPSKPMVERTLKAVLAAIKDKLKSIQVDQNVPSDLFITAQTLTTSPQPVAVHKAQTQKAVIAFLGVLVFLVAAILLLERRRAGRLARRSTVVEPDDSPEPQQGTAGEPGAAAAPAAQVASPPVTKPVSTPVSKPVSQPVSKPVSKPVSQPVSKAVPAPASQPVVKAATAPMPQPTVVGARRARGRGRAAAVTSNGTSSTSSASTDSARP